MSRYNSSSPYKGYVLLSKVKYIRNPAKQSFSRLLDPKSTAEILSRLDALLQGNGFRQEKLGSGVNPQIMALAEKSFIERDIVCSQGHRAIYLNEPCNLLVALGGEDLITVSSVVSGLSVEEALNMASGVEELLDREVDFAYSEGIGYLSPRISRSGSGLSLSASLYLPSLRHCGMHAICSLLSEHSLALEPMFSDKDNSGDIYTLSFVPHYLADESGAQSFFSCAVTAIAEREGEVLSRLFSDKEKTVSNRARRALGALLCSDSLGEKELFEYISDIRLCHCTSKQAHASLPDIAALNYLSSEGLNCSVMASSKEKICSQDECDTARARLVRDYIEHIKEVK